MGPRRSPCTAACRPLLPVRGMTITTTAARTIPTTITADRTAAGIIAAD